MKTVGVWDSGVGGLSVLRALLAEVPEVRFVYVADSAWAPYGGRSADVITERALNITQALLDRAPLDALVVACNTATAGAIDALRARHVSLPVVGVEPALRPAAQASQSGHVGVLATRGTLASRRYADLVARIEAAYPKVHFSSQACEGLADAIEQGDGAGVRRLCQAAWDGLQAQSPLRAPIDQLVLGCTHYPFARAELERLCGLQVSLIDPADAVARQTRRVLDLPATTVSTRVPNPPVEWLDTGNTHALARAARRWIDPRADVQVFPV
ncbi:MAG TPA: glutamate racemase [Hydrogenophaga sp.]|uniref:glutamate racemase n=1 Tax=Hydrogenophaga sp. TaxID=1904254 RepID=UPI002B6D801E|nr:glutamate racemase [Hydrogenophaga sp.]HMN93727.1 glutamate racemase [Hydrogenophaga sp.]HMP09156.1 glutamate racemase [Hydrogenophaga sp.]